MSPSNAKQHRSKTKWYAHTVARVYCAVGAVLLIGFAIITTPFVMRAISEYQQNATVQQTQREVDGWPYPQAENQLKTAASTTRNSRLAARPPSARSKILLPAMPASPPLPARMIRWPPKIKNIRVCSTPAKA